MIKIWKTEKNTWRLTRVLTLKGYRWFVECQGESGWTDVGNFSQWKRAIDAIIRFESEEN
jgi:hypothetical protein